MKTNVGFLLLFVILLIDYFCYGLIVPLVTEKLHMDTGQNAILGSGLVIMLSPTYLVALPIICAISNLWGRKKTFLICLAMSVVSYILFLGGAFIGSVFIVLLSMNLSDITTAELPIAQSIAADTVSPLRRSYFFALLAIADLVDIISTQLHDYLHQITNYQWFNPTLIAAIVVPVSLINLLFAARYLPSSPPVVEEKGRDLLTEIIESFIYILSSKAVRILLIFFAIFSLVWGLYFQNIYFFFTETGVTHPERASLLIIYSCILMFVTLIILYPIMIRLFSLKNLLFGCLFVSGIGLALMSFALTKDGRWTTGMMIAISTPMIIPIVWTLLSSQVERKHQVMLFGIAYLILNLFWEVSGAIVKIFNMVDSALPLQISAILMLCNILLLFRYKKAFAFEFEKA